MKLFGGKKTLPKHAKDRLLNGSNFMHDAVLDARSISDLLTAYVFKSDEKIKAGFLLAGMTAGSFAIAYNGVQIGKQIGFLMGSLEQLRNSNIMDRWEIFTDQRNMVLGMAALQVALVCGRHLCASNYNRKASRWVTERFSSAVNRAGMHMTQNVSDKNEKQSLTQKEDLNSPQKVAKSVDQIMSDSVKGFYSGATGLYLGLLTATTGFGVAAHELLKLSQPVPEIQSMGEYGLAAYATGLGAVSIGLGTLAAIKLGRLIKNGTTQLLQSEGEYRFYAQSKIKGAFQIAANGGHYLQNLIGQKVYDMYDKSWLKKNYIDAGFMGFKGLYSPLVSHCLVHLPVLGLLYNGSIGFGHAMAISGVVAACWSNLDIIIDETPAISNAKSNAYRMLALSRYIRAVEQPQEFYRKTGTSEFEYKTHALDRGIVVSDLELMHEGKDASPYLSLGKDYRQRSLGIELKPGDWATLMGPSGCGKSHFMTALLGARPDPDGRSNLLNAYGRGTIATGKGAKFFYFPQDTVFEPVSLKQLVAYPQDGEEAHSDREVVNMMKVVGLEKYIDHIHEDIHEGKPWQEILSGGERKKLMAARAILKNADYYLLDEPTTGLDSHATRNFYQTLKTYCGHSIVICITHEKPPLMDDGHPYFNAQLDVIDGVLRRNHAAVFDRHLYPRLVSRGGLSQAGGGMAYLTHAMPEPPKY